MGKPNPVVLIIGIVLVLIICGVIGFLLIDDGKHFYKISFNQDYDSSHSDFTSKFKTDLIELLDDTKITENNIEIFNNEILKNQDNKFALFFKIKDGEYDDKKVTDKISSGERFSTLAMDVDQIESYELPNTSDDCSNYDETNCGQVKLFEKMLRVLFVPEIIVVVWNAVYLRLLLLLLLLLLLIIILVLSVV